MIEKTWSRARCLAIFRLRARIKERSGANPEGGWSEEIGFYLPALSPLAPSPILSSPVGSPGWVISLHMRRTLGERARQAQPRTALCGRCAQCRLPQRLTAEEPERRILETQETDFCRKTC